ncbi:ribonuclease J [Candidatus Saccharibacteria bacterium]|nr:ribonuclease J [Candidatus Saccharibacteria bacterium]
MVKPRMQPKNPEEKREKVNKYQNNSKQNGQPQQRVQISQMTTNRGEAMRAGRRNFETADKAVDRWNVFEKHHEHAVSSVLPVANNRLRVTFLGGLEGIGEKNMMVLEYGDDAIIVDAGFDLSVDLPGVNYAIPATTYLETIKHKIRAYAITHGHMDHIAALPYVYEQYPAPIFCASHFCSEMVEKQFMSINEERGTDLQPERIVLNMDDHERYVLTPNFTIEFLRITHSIPDCSTLVIDTPIGRVVNTGDFRLDPEPLDHHPSDVTRLKQIGEENKTLLLMTDSTNARYAGRTPTEHTLQQSFHDIFAQARGRIFVAIFSTNMNRVQMIINSAVAAGRKVAFDGRGMMQVSEIAVRTGNLKIPKGSVVAMREVPNVKDDQVVVVCTGGQGEPNAALQRMSIGEHKHIKLKAEDTVVVSSSPIPGNEVRYQQIGNDLAEIGVHLYRQVTHDLDGCGPLHVSGHANQDELKEMVEMVKPKYLLPIHGGMLDRKYGGMAGIDAGLSKDNILLPKNGSMVEFDSNGAVYDAGEAPAGAVLVDQTGAVVPGLVAKDRLLMSEEGMVVVMLTIDKKSGRLLTSPDIITRGFIYIRDNAELMDGLRAELKRAASQRFTRVDLDRFKQELKDHISHYLYEHTRRSPVLIPVVNVIGSNGQGTARPKPQFDSGR